MASQPRDGVLRSVVPDIGSGTFFMGNKKICSCFGDFVVEITDELKAKTNEAIEKAIASGIRIFLFGGLSDFDDLVYDIVSEKRAVISQIKRVFCFPQYEDLISFPNWFKIKEYEDLICPEKVCELWYRAFYYRNRAMINQSDIILFYAEKRENSIVYEAYKHAKEFNKKIINYALDNR